VVKNRKGKEKGENQSHGLKEKEGTGTEDSRIE